MKKSQISPKKSNKSVPGPNSESSETSSSIEELLKVILDKNEANQINEFDRQPVIFTSGTGPADFYIIPFQHVDSAYKLDHWISNNVGNMELPEKITWDLVGKVVACFRSDKPRWFRGFVMDLLTSTNVKIKALEYGNEYNIHLSKIRILPEELANLAPFGVASKLANAVPLRYEPAFDAAARREFIDIMKGCGKKSLEAVISSYDEKAEKFNVILWKDNILVNSEVMDDYLFRKRTPIKVISDNNPPTGVIDVVAVRRAQSSPAISSAYFLPAHNRLMTVTKIINPEDFFITQIITDKYGKDARIKSKMQEFYDNKFNAFNYKLRADQPFFDRYYVCKVTKTGLWEACRVIERTLCTRSCKIHVLNLDEFLVHVSFDDIYEMRPEFITLGERSIHCSLLDVKPPHGMREWPEESIRAFKNLTIGKQFHCLFLTKRQGLLTCGAPETKIELEVVLLGKYSIATVNVQLCRLAYATSTGLSSDRIRESDPNFDRIDLVRELKHGDDDGDKEVKTTEAKQNQFPSYYNDWLSHKACVLGFNSRTSEEIRKTIGMYRIPSFVSPACIYIQKLERIPQLYNMILNLTVQMENEENEMYPYDLLTEGNFVAVPKEEVGGKIYYQRAVVREVVSYEEVKVVLVDFGTSFSVRAMEVRALPTNFLKIPGFAQRAHMHTKPNSKHRLWPSNATYISENFLKAHTKNSNNYNCHAWWKTSVTLKLEEYNQMIIYSHVKQCWESGKRLQVTAEQGMHMMKRHPLLANLYSSIGIDIIFQNKIKDSIRKRYEVEKLSTVLISDGFASEE